MGLQYFIGIDLGGTKITAGLVSRNFEIFGEIVRKETESYRSRNVVLENIENTISGVIRANKKSLEDVIGIGIGTPGPIDLETGKILNPENLLPLNYFNLKEYLFKKFKIEIKLNNDAACFVLGEHIAGKGKEFDNIVGLTLGTGTGCGLIINGKLYNGATGTSGEIWKTPYLDRNIEEYTSAKAVRSFFYKRKGENLRAGQVADLAEKGDKFALETWSEYGKHLGILISGLINVLDPEAVILGGSLSKAFKFFENDLKEILEKNINKKPLENIKIEVSDLGEEGAIIGAAALD